MTQTGEGYIKQIEAMMERASKWLDAHPQAETRIQFNFPKEIFFIAPISTALEEHVVSANEEGMELIKAMAPDIGTPNEPTVTMVRIAIEAL